MYRQIPWELVTDPLGFMWHTLGNTGLTIFFLTLPTVQLTSHFTWHNEFSGTRL